MELNGGFVKMVFRLNASEDVMAAVDYFVRTSGRTLA
jgi:hypothetical protein